MNGEWIEKPGPDNDTCVIFVHGVLSSGQSCWLSENGTYWPTLLRQDTEHQHLGIYVFTYRTDFFSGHYRLGDASSALKENLKLDGVLVSKKLVFVCHSMGGILVRYFLVTNQIELIEKQREIGLFLLASPSLGSAYANWLKRLAQALGHSQAMALRFSQENDWLNDLDTNFMNLKEGRRLPIKGKELVEDNFVVLKRWWRTQVVEPFSGARYFAEPHKVAFSDHFSIAKPDGNDAMQHRLLLAFIHEMRFPPPVQEFLLDPSLDSQHALKLLIKLPEALHKTVSTGHDDTLEAVNQALLETRRYIRQRQAGAERDSQAENLLSELWYAAYSKILPFDPELANLCLVKGHGWADDTVWSDPRYRDLPIGVNDILEKLLQPAKRAAMTASR